MALEIAVNRTREEVNAALLRFAAQQHFGLTKFNRSDVLRLVVTKAAAAQDQQASSDDNQESDRAAWMDLRLQWRRGKTVVMVDGARAPDHVRLVEELRRFLNDPGEYGANRPPHCSQCGAAVDNPQAVYCGRCGEKIA